MKDIKYLVVKMEVVKTNWYTTLEYISVEFISTSKEGHIHTIQFRFLLYWSSYLPQTLSFPGPVYFPSDFLKIFYDCHHGPQPLKEQKEKKTKASLWRCMATLRQFMLPW